ncbi:cytochrome b5, putative [Paecilomyces variotii No. 5]|uniref:Cytochrome b5, putative n=1 Tax=Byssochlamys spectabilis (strain No. 5 / NBRC 109023) TaxID=1356009 RepID=V5I0Q1_BYSSN|nr:cytochrome b5, putative [Paecilomyces variotii No. 5]
MSKEFTTAEVASHNTKKDLYMVIHDKVYDCTSFVDEHPYVASLFTPPPKVTPSQQLRWLGGEEVLLDVGGQDGTEAFEDVGHSDEAREILAGLEVGTLKRLPGEAAPKTGNPSSVSVPKKDSTGLGVGLYAAVLIGGAAAYFAYQYIQANAEKHYIRLLHWDKLELRKRRASRDRSTGREAEIQGKGKSV